MNRWRQVFSGWRTHAVPMEAENLWAGRGTSAEQPRPRLADPSLESDLEGQGYAIVPEVLDRREIEALRRLLGDNDANVHRRPFATSLHSDDVAYRRAVDIGIRSILDSKVEQLLNDYRLCVANFLVKSPVNQALDGGEVKLHQDIAMVNEALFETLSLWIPLVDTDEENGCLHVIPGSHLYSDCLRWAGATSISDNEVEWLRPQSRVLLLRAGHAVIFGPKLIHWSAPNRSMTRRAVVGGPMAPNAASMIYLHQDGATPEFLDVYSVRDEFYARHTYLTRPRRAKLIARIPARQSELMRPSEIGRSL